MLVLKENQKLYLNSWNYNAARILTELAQIVKNEGGKVAPTKKALIVNRSIMEAIEEQQKRIERIKNNKKATPDIIGKLVTSLNKEVEELEQINNDEIQVTHTSYISFVLNDFYYYYQVDNNPFFEFFYTKQEIENGKIIKSVYLDKDDKNWLFDCFLGFRCSDADIKEAAQLIFNMLTSADLSEVYRDKQRKRVPNYYNNGYHYETIYSPIEYKTIDFKEV